MFIIKKFIIFILLGLCVGWSFRIVQINRDKKQVSVYDMNEPVVGEEISVTAVEAHLYDEQKEFYQEYSIDDTLFEVYQCPDAKVLCVCLNVKNISNHAVEWDQVDEWINCGFESRTWGSSNYGEAGQRLNLFYTDKLYAGKEQRIWYVTLVAPTCFKDKTWNALSVDDFRYTMTLFPQKIQIRLE